MGRAGHANIAGRLSSSSKAQKGVGRSAEKCEFPDVSMQCIDYDHHLAQVLANPSKPKKALKKIQVSSSSGAKTARKRNNRVTVVDIATDDED